jgi:Ca2+-binding EF-hand superfamily protein
MSLTTWNVLLGVMQNPYFNISGALLKQAFSLLDTNHSGSMNKQEILAMIKELDPRVQTLQDAGQAGNP